MHAAAKGKLCAVRFLLDEGADASTLNNLELSALDLAVNAREARVRLSGRVGGRCLSVWFGAWKTSRPFWLALSLGDVGALRAALRGGQDINARNADGFTALMLASVSGDARMVLFLLEQGANVSALHHITNSSALDITEFVEADVMK
ncbi:ankyrin repeat-containing domain protein, partial [Baffinella frigidus]